MYEDLPWIPIETVGYLLGDFFGSLGDFFGGLLGVSGGSILSFSDLPIRMLDIVLLLLVGGLAFFYFYYTDAISKIEAARDARVKAMYIRPKVEEVRNERWAKIERLFRSDGESDWRLAVIEADAMLDELLMTLGVPGSTMGERLMSLNKGNFPALDHAWEAHRARNRIAHEGMNYHMTGKDALHIMNMYQVVFRDSRYI